LYNYTGDFYDIKIVMLPEQNKRIAPLFLYMDVEKATKGLIAFTPEIDCDQTAMGLSPVTSAVLLIAK
jgi:hypothetical protein